MKRKILDESLHINHLIGYQYGDRGILREESQIPEISQYILDTFFQNESKLNCVDESWRFPVWVALEATDIPILYIKLALGIIKRESGYAHVFKMPSFSSPSPITRWGAVSVFKSLGNKKGWIKERRSKQLEKWVWDDLEKNLFEKIKSNPKLVSEFRKLQKKMFKNAISPTEASKKILQHYLKNNKS